MSIPTHLRRRPSFALVVAVLALVIAMSGTSYAAMKLPAKSVGTPQLKNNAVTSPKVKDGSLKAADFAPGQLPRGPQGPPGPANPLTFHALALNGAWTSTDGVYETNVAGYGKDGFGVVHLQGGVRDTGAATDLVGTLPPGSRPAHYIYATSWGYNAQYPAFVRIDPNGTVHAYPAAGSGTNYLQFTSLEGITFRAAS